MITVVVSGAKSSEPQVRTALASAGFQVLKTVHDHGFPPEETGEPIAFVTVLAEEEQLDAVAKCAASLSYRLRLHHETPPEPTPSAEMQIAATLADMRREIDELKDRVA
jgi:vacuolar-type H+-ATPase subunit I/STV1